MIYKEKLTLNIIIIFQTTVFGFLTGFTFGRHNCSLFWLRTINWNDHWCCWFNRLLFRLQKCQFMLSQCNLSWARRTIQCAAVWTDQLLFNATNFCWRQTFATRCVLIVLLRWTVAKRLIVAVDTGGSVSSGSGSSDSCSGTLAKNLKAEN